MLKTQVCNSQHGFYPLVIDWLLRYIRHCRFLTLFCCFRCKKGFNTSNNLPTDVLLTIDTEDMAAVDIYQVEQKDGNKLSHRLF